MSRPTLWIRGGRVVDPASGLDDEADVLVRDRKIAQVGRVDVSAGEPVIEIDARVYDSGIGIRYRFPADGGWGKQIELTGDKTEFNFAGDYTGYSYRREQDPLGPIPLSRFPSCLLPLTVKCADDVHIALLESAVFNESP